MPRELPTLVHLDGRPTYEVLDVDGLWGWSIETATENWDHFNYDSEADAIAGAWQHAVEHFKLEAVRRIEFRYLDLPEQLPRARRMSFFLTTAQVLARTKTVTRRAVSTWTKLGPGDRLLAIEKGQGLRAGEGHRVLALLEVVDVRVELLTDITYDDCKREGFPDLTPEQFVEFYRRAA